MQGVRLHFRAPGDEALRQEEARLPRLRGDEAAKSHVAASPPTRRKDQRLEGFDPSRPQDASFYKDDRNIGLWAQKRARQMGVDLGDSFGEILEKGRSKKILDNL